MAVRRLDTRFGQQLCFDTDIYFFALLANYGEYGYGETDLFRQILQAGDTVVDAGANIGCHSLAFAKFVGPTGTVLAFEPQRPIYYALCGSIALNEAWQVTTFNCALGDHSGVTKVPNLDYSKMQSFGSASVGVEDGYEVPIKPLDGFDLQRLRLLKVDVEGLETEVLLGARETIRRCRPLLYVENDRKENSTRLIETMIRMEYNLFLHTPTLFHENNYKGSKTNLFPKIVSIMLFGVPAESPFDSTNLKQIRCAEDMGNFGEHRPNATS